MPSSPLDERQILKDQPLLQQFLKRTQSVADTPALIQLVLSDRRHLVMCRAIATQGAGNGITAICRQLKMDVDTVRRRLIPVAQALGLLAGTRRPMDYYRVLGVLPTAGPDDIRNAFRKKAIAVHPDSGRGSNAGNRAFVELHTAYKTLMDPTLRALHDRCRRDFGSWVEEPVKTPIRARQKWRRLSWLLWVLLFLSGAAFILDAVLMQP